LHDGLTLIVHGVRTSARTLARKHFRAELAAIIGEENANQITLHGGKSPAETDVGRYIDNAVQTARVMVSQATLDEADVAEACRRADYHAQAIVDSETTVAYRVARVALSHELAAIPDDEAEALGFALAQESSDLRALDGIETRADDDRWIAIVGERWDARADACPRCASVHGEIRPFGVSFSEAGPTVHARCQCIRSLWAVPVPIKGKRAIEMKSHRKQNSAVGDVAWFVSSLGTRAIDDDDDDDDKRPEEERVIRGCIASTEAIDEHGSTIKANGWDLSRYEQNPILLWNHALSSFAKDAEPEDILGRCAVQMRKKRLVCDLHFDNEDVNPKAERVYRQCKAGTIRMLSVGFRPLQWHYEKRGENDGDLLVIDKALLLEISVTPIGSNPDAMLPRSMDLRAMCPALEEREEDVQPQGAATCGACASTTHKENEMDKAILEVLGMSAEATDAEVLATAARMRDQSAAFVSLAGADSTEAAMGVFRAWQASAERAVELETELSAIRAEEAKRERDSVIERGVREMKLCPAELDGWVKDASVEMLRKYLETAPARAKSAPTPQPELDDVELTPEDRHFMAKAGIDEKTYRETKRSLVK